MMTAIARWDGDHIGYVVVTAPDPQLAMGRALNCVDEIVLELAEEESLPSDLPPSVHDLLANVHDVLDPFDAPAKDAAQ